MTISDAIIRKMRETTEVLSGERGPGPGRAVRHSDLDGITVGAARTLRDDAVATKHVKKGAISQQSQITSSTFTVTHPANSKFGYGPTTTLTITTNGNDLDILFTTSISKIGTINQLSASANMFLYHDTTSGTLLGGSYLILDTGYPPGKTGTLFYRTAGLTAGVHTLDVLPWSFGAGNQPQFQWSASVQIFAREIKR